MYIPVIAGRVRGGGRPSGRRPRRGAGVIES